jgi:hypothetical protein
MPQRGEFEEEFNDEVEHILDGLEFDEERESQESFDQKMNMLLCYNSQLLERKARTQAVEDWQPSVAPDPADPTRRTTQDGTAVAETARVASQEEGLAGVERVAVKHSGGRERGSGTLILLSLQKALSPVNRAV